MFELSEVLAGMQNEITTYVVYGEVMMVWMASVWILYRYEESEDERDSRRTKKMA